MQEGMIAIIGAIVAVCCSSSSVTAILLKVQQAKKAKEAIAVEEAADTSTLHIVKHFTIIY
jgi:hypothetical protein